MRRASPSEQAGPGLGFQEEARGGGPRPWLRRTLWTCPMVPRAFLHTTAHRRCRGIRPRTGPLSLDLQAGLDCCCLALQLPRPLEPSAWHGDTPAPSSTVCGSSGGQ